MTDSDFTVDVLAQEVGISRSGLFAKIKAISGMTPNDYIRLIRLKKAAYLLAEEEVSSSEACFRVGFLLLLICEMFPGTVRHCSGRIQTERW